MSLIVIPSALRNRLWARARARGAGSWVIVCSRRSRWVSSRGWTYRTVGTLSFGVASETKVWITWYTGGYYAKKLLVRHLIDSPWEHWRKKNPRLKPDLRGAKFVDCSFRFVDFRGADLSEAQFTSVDLT